MGESAERQEASKKQSLTSICAAFGWAYKPLCFESTGAWGPEATRFIKHLVWSSFLRDGLTLAERFSVVARTVSGCLAKASAEMLARSFSS